MASLVAIPPRVATATAAPRDTFELFAIRSIAQDDAVVLARQTIDGEPQDAAQQARKLLRDTTARHGAAGVAVQVVSTLTGFPVAWEALS